MAREQSTARAYKNDQRDETVVKNVPEGPPEPPSLPDEPANRQNEPLSVELEERRSGPRFDETFTNNEAHASGVPSCDEDDRCVSKKPRNTSEHVSERLKRRGEENSPREVPEDPDEQGSEMAAPAP